MKNRLELALHEPPGTLEKVPALLPHQTHSVASPRSRSRPGDTASGAGAQLQLCMETAASAAQWLAGLCSGERESILAGTRLEESERLLLESLAERDYDPPDELKLMSCWLSTRALTRASGGDLDPADGAAVAPTTAALEDKAASGSIVAGGRTAGGSSGEFGTSVALQGSAAAAAAARSGAGAALVGLIFWRNLAAEEVEEWLAHPPAAMGSAITAPAPAADTAAAELQPEACDFAELETAGAGAAAAAASSAESSSQNWLKIELMATDRRARGRGIGKYLLSAALASATAQHGKKHAVLHVAGGLAANPTAAALYRKFGFHKPPGGDSFFNAPNQHVVRQRTVLPFHSLSIGDFCRSLPFDGADRWPLLPPAH
eukprot:SAG22_NODE_1647_length_3899_cov_39.380789_4_plen_375_part_00